MSSALFDSFRRVYVVCSSGEDCVTHYTWGPDQTKLTPSALHNNQKERAKQFRRHLPFPLRYFYSYTVHYTIYRADIKQTDREQVAQTNTQYFARHSHRGEEVFHNLSLKD